MNGIEGLAVTLQEIPVKLRRRALRNALAAGARIVRDSARFFRRTNTAGSPLTGNAISRFRRRGTVEKAINVRTSKIAAQAGDVGVYVNVRPLGKGAGAHNPSDPYYWRWIEFGSKFARAFPFLLPAAARLVDALHTFERTLGPQIARLNTNPKDPL